ncbi:MAG: TrmO family methyltransferase, partial [Pseudomonadota bacterium]|nr:TrmO family methyltransferase [Pseudomonadota bacterium]
MSFEFNPIGYAETPYPEKFSIPRQPGLVTADESCIRLEGKTNREEILRGLDGFSHIWLVFVFHEAMRDDWKP